MPSGYIKRTSHRAKHQIHRVRARDRGLARRSAGRSSDWCKH